VASTAEPAGTPPPSSSGEAAPAATDEPAALAPQASRWARWQAPAAYAGAALISLVAAVFLLGLRDASLRVPFDYAGDSLEFSMTIKAVIEQGWYLTIARLGAPGVLSMHDYPLFDLFHDLLFKVMGWFSDDWGLLLNLDFLAGFPLIAISALAVFRHFRVAYAPALMSAVLYAFLPCRLIKGEGHIHLSNYYQVPLAMLVALWVCGDDPPLFRDGSPGRWPCLDLRRGRSLAAIAIALLTAGTGLYFAFFSAPLILLGGVWASLRRRTPRHALAGLVLVALIVAGLAAQAAPSIAYQRRNSPNEQVGNRSPHEAELFGLKLTQLLLPAPNHRLPALRQLKANYDALSVSEGGESKVISLGLVGAAGFLWLLAILLLGRRPDHRPRDELLVRLAVLSLLAVLIGTLGGFGSLFAFFVTPGIRTYCRIGVLIAFLSFFASALLIERLGAGRQGRTAALAAALLCLGLFDQGTLDAIRPYQAIAEAYRADARFVARIEAAVPPGAMIFQLPYQRFPEAARTRELRMMSYDPLRFYLHSRSVHWSYPTMANRAGDAWTSRVAEEAPATMIETLSDTDFDGIVVDRFGYRDQGAAIEAGLAGVLGPPRLVSDDQRYAWFDLAPHRRAAAASISAEEHARRRDAALHLVHARWGRGFFDDEQDTRGHFHWSSGQSVLEIDNTWDVPRQVEFKTTFVAANPPSVVGFGGELMSGLIEIPPQGAPFSRTLTVPPGRHVVRFGGTGRPAYAPTDPRTLIWRLYDTEIRDLGAGPDGQR